MKRYSYSEKIAAISEYLDSGKTLRQFSRTKDYSIHALAQWFRAYKEGNLFDLYSKQERKAIICQLSVFNTFDEKYEAIKHYGFYSSKSTMIDLIERFERGNSNKGRTKNKKPVQNNFLRLALGFK